MIRNLLIFGLATLALGAPQVPYKRFGTRIVGGNDVNITEHPHQVSVEWTHEGYVDHVCGGSIIHKKFVVTAAQCTTDFLPGDLQIRAGTSTIVMHATPVEGTVDRVIQIHTSPDFNSHTNDYDITILELSEPLQWSDLIQPIALPESDTPIAEGTVVNVTDWGALSKDDWEFSSQLQVMEISIVGNKECDQIYIDDHITDRMFCAGAPKGGKDTCTGDLGGPLSANGVLLGIVSWGHDCYDPGYPGVYGNVSAFRSFIDTVVPN